MRRIPVVALDGAMEVAAARERLKVYERQEELAAVVRFVEKNPGLIASPSSELRSAMRGYQKADIGVDTRRETLLKQRFE